MELKAKVENGKEFFVVESKNIWTGKVSSKKFTTRKSAEEYIKAVLSTKTAERKILDQKKITQGSANITVHSLLKLYFEHALKNENTIRQSGYHASQIVEAFGKCVARLVSSLDIRNFMAMQQQRGCAQITINRRVAILRTAINWAISQGMFESHQLGEIRLPRSAPKKIYPPSPDELSLMLKVASKHIVRVILVGLYTGARVGPSELFKLEWNHIDLWARVIHLPCAEKNAKITTRDIPIRESLMSHLQEWKNEDAHFKIPYVIHYGGQPVRTIARACLENVHNKKLYLNHSTRDSVHPYHPDHEDIWPVKYHKTEKNTAGMQAFSRNQNSQKA